MLDFPQKSISGITFLFGNLATGHFSGKLFLNGPSSSHAGSNDTGLMSVSGPGAEPIKVQTDRQTFLNIIYKDNAQKTRNH